MSSTGCSGLSLLDKYPQSWLESDQPNPPEDCKPTISVRKQSRTAHGVLLATFEAPGIASPGRAVLPACNQNCAGTTLAHVGQVAEAAPNRHLPSSADSSSNKSCGTRERTRKATSTCRTMATRFRSATSRLRFCHKPAADFPRGRREP